MHPTLSYELDDAQGRRCSPPACSDQMRRASALWRRRSGSPCGSSVPMAAPAGWRKSSATIRRQPPSACARSGRWSAGPKTITAVACPEAADSSGETDPRCP